MGLVPRGQMADPLWFGIGIHEALAKWYGKGKRRGPHPAKTFAKWVGQEERDIRANYADRDKEWFDSPKFEDARDLGIAMLEGYVDKYGKDQNWDVIAIERQFRVLVTWDGVPIAEFWSTWDGVYRDLDDGLVKLMEHKTAAQIMLAYLDIDDQGGAYWAVAGPILRAEGVLKLNEQISEITYNFLRKSMQDERPTNDAGMYLNKDGSISKKQPPPYFIREPVERIPAEQKIQMQRLAEEVTVMNAMRDGTIPVTKSTQRDCPSCEFFLMCKTHEHGGNGWEAIMRADFNQANPYGRYEKSA
jgi:PD-(D/E)XK nuclease superfamily